MTRLDKFLKVYKDAAECAKRCSDSPNMDTEEYMAFVEIRNGAANDVAKEILRVIEAGEVVHISDIPTLRTVLREVTDGPAAR